MIMAFPFRSVRYALCLVFFLASTVQSDEVTALDPVIPAPSVFQQKFDSLKESIAVFAEKGAFWELGNALHSLVNYCEVADIDCSSIGEMALDLYYQKIMIKSWWKDDHGWFGALFVQLFEATD
ncbi:MAG TPA: hypothetical protein VEL47_03535, partial [Myxococcota bacterium]|nr:hypothetical protein [Myxococcota bacterium]